MLLLFVNVQNKYDKALLNGLFIQYGNSLMIQLS